MPLTRWLSPSLLALAGACSDARYDSPDASSLVDASFPTREAIPDTGQRPPIDIDDAGANEDASSSTPWHARLARHFAISIRFFGKDRGLADAALFSHEIIHLAKLDVVAGKVSMQTLRCRDHGTGLALGILGEFGWSFPEKLLPQSFELVMRADGLRTEAAPRPIGFTLEQPAGCTPGKQLAVTGRSWLPGGSCECSADELPRSARDCRIVDEDGDGNPAITIYRKGPINDPEHTRLLDRSQIVQGQLAADGSIDALFVDNYDALALNCGGISCIQNLIASCPLELNRVRFEPLSDRDWTCEDVLSEVDAGKLFPLPPLVFVNGC
ncbi:MAG TPA: hypothetical protein VFX59_24355 [Polyangiales bacterium]|nr:hypothetical protein [Polyangiales bacterium]